MDYTLAIPTSATSIYNKFKYLGELSESLVDVAFTKGLVEYEYRPLIQHKLLLAWGKSIGIPDGQHIPSSLQVDVFRVLPIMAEMGTKLGEAREIFAGFEGRVPFAHSSSSRDGHLPLLQWGPEILTKLIAAYSQMETLYNTLDNDRKITFRQIIGRVLREMVIETDTAVILGRRINTIMAICEADHDNSEMSTTLSPFLYLLRLKDMRCALEAGIRSGQSAKCELVDKYSRDSATVSILDSESAKIFQKLDASHTGTHDPRRHVAEYPAGSGEYAWIEWRTTEPNREPSAYYEALLRSLVLAHMLALPGPKHLSLPTCTGFVKFESQHSRCGFIFQLPPNIDKDIPFVTLHSILGGNEYTPSLDERVAMAAQLASCVLELHAADWHHQAINSGNVIFYRDNGIIRFDKPVLSGFEYPRPYRDTVEPRGLDEKWDIYRWTSAQGEVLRAGNSSEIHDIYSLGLVLLEIARWERLDKFMKLHNWPRPSQRNLRIRGWLLNRDDFPPFQLNPLSELPGLVGEKYHRATLRCLHAHGQSGMGVDVPIRKPSTPRSTRLSSRS